MNRSWNLAGSCPTTEGFSTRTGDSHEPCCRVGSFTRWTRSNHVSLCIVRFRDRRGSQGCLLRNVRLTLASACMSAAPRIGLSTYMVCNGGESNPGDVPSTSTTATSRHSRVVSTCAWTRTGRCAIRSGRAARWRSATCSAGQRTHPRQARRGVRAAQPPVLPRAQFSAGPGRRAIGRAGTFRRRRRGAAAWQDLAYGLQAVEGRVRHLGWRTESSSPPTRCSPSPRPPSPTPPGFSARTASRSRRSGSRPRRH